MLTRAIEKSSLNYLRLCTPHWTSLPETILIAPLKTQKKILGTHSQRKFLSSKATSAWLFVYMFPFYSEGKDKPDRGGQVKDWDGTQRVWPSQEPLWMPTLCLIIKQCRYSHYKPVMCWGALLRLLRKNRSACSWLLQGWEGDSDRPEEMKHVCMEAWHVLIEKPRYAKASACTLAYIHTF